MLQSSDAMEVAVAAAHRAGDIQLDLFGKTLTVDKHLADDVKLEADRLCEKAIIETIRAAFPNHAIIAEESGRAEGAEYIWYVDPLDGTVNYYYGIPYFCTTMACCRYPKSGDITPGNLGEAVAAVTFAPATGDMFIATPERGLTLNGRPVRVREETSLSEAYIISAYGSSEEKLRFSREILLPLGPKVRKIRNLGALAYDIANVAAGRGSGVMQLGLQVWDIAAGRVMVEAAGGRFYAKRHASGMWSIAAGAGVVYEEMAARLDAYE